VDNTPADAASLSDKLDNGRVDLIRSGRNMGLAAALNVGLRALPDDTEAVLFLDQDSVLPPELVLGLAAHLADPQIGVIGPAPVDAATGKGYERFERLHDTLADRFAVITSGMVVRRSCFDLVPGFREDFFVDWVDNDFCLRVRRNGLRVVLDRAHRLPHSIGDGKDHRLLFWTVRVLHYSAWRHYWVARNGVVLCREQLRHQPGWSVSYLVYMTRWILSTALYEPARRTHLPAFFRGVRDGFAGRVTRRYLPAGATYQGVDAR
jgi:rhamnosyltransferase